MITVWLGPPLKPPVLAVYDLSIWSRLIGCNTFCITQEIRIGREPLHVRQGPANIGRVDEKNAVCGRREKKDS